MATVTGTGSGDLIQPGTPTTYGSDGADIIYGGGGADTIYSGVDSDTVYGGNGRDTIYGGDAGDILYGEDSADVVYGGAGNDTLFGGADGGPGDDALYGGSGFDFVSYSGVSGAVTVNLGTGGASGGDGVDNIFEVEGVIGGSGADVITGSTGDNWLIGGGGADTIDGGAGNDTIDGGAGADSLVGGSGTDTAAYYTSTAAVQVTINGSANTGGAAAGDTLSGFENLTGSFYSDSLTGDGAANYIDGAGGSDTILGGAGNDTINGGDGADTLYGGDGDDRFVLGVSPGNDVIYGGEGVETSGDTLDASSQVTAGVSLNLTGAETGSLTTAGGTVSFNQVENFVLTDHADTVSASATTAPINVNAMGGNDSMVGSGGNDTLDGGTGSDTISGGASQDLIYGGSTGPATTTYITNGTFTGGGTGWSGTDTEFNPESSYFTGASTVNGVTEIDGHVNQTTVLQQSFTVAGATSAQLTFRGAVRAAGDVGIDGFRVDVLNSAGAVIATMTVIPGSNSSWTDYALSINFPAAGTYTLRFTELGDDDSAGAILDDVQITSSTIIADVGDSLSGDAGNDTIYGGDGADTIAGGADQDTLYGDAGNDTLYGDAGNDQLFGGTGNDGLNGGIGQDTLNGDAGNDTLYGDAGNDQLYGGADNDLAYGGADQDTLYGDAGNDTLYGDAGNDQLYGGADNDLAYGGADQDTLYGDAGNDTLYGDAGNDSLNGGADNDRLYGGTNNDTLVGGAGTDLVFGGDDRDLITMTANDGVGNETVDGGSGAGTSSDNDTLSVDITGFGWARFDLNYDPTNHENGTIIFYGPGPGFPVLGTLTFTDIENLVIVCFTAGTQIMTDRGAVAVEALSPGDLVVTRDNGLQPLRWTGTRKLSYADLQARPDLQPVRIGAGALDGIGPDRSILVSPQHRVLIEGARSEMYFGESEVLVPAKYLTGLAEVTRALPSDGITYVHILFDRHEIVQSEGIWTESFQPAERTLNALDEAARAEVLELFPELASDMTGFPSARLSLKAHEARVLVSA
ncbi:MAG: Hint domain-containing protein [Rhodobacterales bacterium]|nr:Hint domain-containing protein [Rhodobacterales bacterium]